MGTAFPAEDGTGASHGARASQGPEGDRNARIAAREPPSGWRNPPLEHAVPELAVMANVLNPETESITLNTELETPTLEPATELETLPRIDQPSPESTSNPETAAVVEAPPLDADALTEPAAQVATRSRLLLKPRTAAPKHARRCRGCPPSGQSRSPSRLRCRYAASARAACRAAPLPSQTPAGWPPRAPAPLAPAPAVASSCARACRRAG